LSSSLRELVDQYFDALNHDRLDALERVFHQDIELRHPGIPPRIGRAAAIGLLARVFDKFPMHMDRPTRVWEAEDAIVVEIDFKGRDREGREVRMAAVDIFEFGEGAIIRLSQWFDTAGLARQLDHNSSPGAPPTP
jgi:ketosteroid isomerase-like protein